MADDERRETTDPELRDLAATATLSYAVATRLAKDLLEITADLARYAAEVREDRERDDR